MLTKSPLRGRGGTAAEVNREYLERLTDAVAVGEMHHSDALSRLEKSRNPNACKQAPAQLIWFISNQEIFRDCEDNQTASLQDICKNPASSAHLHSQATLAYLLQCDRTKVPNICKFPAF